MGDEKMNFMRLALDVAREGMEHGELPIGAVVVLDGRVIGSAYTQELAQRRNLVHADLLALEAADRLHPFPGRRRAATLYVTLEPCLMCLGAAMSFFVGEVVFALESPSDGATALVQSWQRKTEGFPQYQIPTITGGILREASAELFAEYVERNPTGSYADWARSLLGSGHVC